MASVPRVNITKNLISTFPDEFVSSFSVKNHIVPMRRRLWVFVWLFLCSLLLKCSECFSSSSSRRCLRLRPSEWYLVCQDTFFSRSICKQWHVQTKSIQSVSVLVQVNRLTRKAKFDKYLWNFAHVLYGLCSKPKPYEQTIVIVMLAFIICTQQQFLWMIVMILSY